VPFAKPLPQYILLGTAAIAGVTALAYLAMSLGANLDSATSAEMIRDRATPWLNGKGKGDTFFTQWEYDVPQEGENRPGLQLHGARQKPVHARQPAQNAQQARHRRQHHLVPTRLAAAARGRVTPSG
jgi:hypothetical protein